MSVTFDRRRLLGLGAAGAVTALTTNLSDLLTPSGARAAAAPSGRGRLPSGLFTLGVASGEPTDNGVVLWTRLAPDPLNGGGMPPYDIPVQWQVATDERFQDVVAAGASTASTALGHSVHVEVDRLQPASWYWYRFRVGDELSPAARTKTAPAAGTQVGEMRFAHASCQSYPAGYYTAYRHMSEEDLDLVIHVGDYIYEGAGNANELRRHEGTGEPITLEQYRNRHAQYRSDLDLQAAHQAFPWMVVLDDHEIDNDWADEIPQDPHVQPREAFLARRAAALQAYYEHMPLRRSSIPRHIDIQLYRRLTFGDLLDVHILDTRQYRSDQDQALRLDPNRSIMGAEQKAWLFESLAGPTAQWNLIAQQLFFCQRDYAAGEATQWHLDTWDNYVAERDALRDHLAAAQTSNPVIITGDDHCNYVTDVMTDWNDPASAPLGTEFVGTSMTSGGDGVENNAGDAVLYAENPHIRYINRKRGYVRHHVTRDTWTADYRRVEYVRTLGSPISTGRSFVIENGHPGVQPA
jgi:alkaline phosphatase D